MLPVLGAAAALPFYHAYKQQWPKYQTYKAGRKATGKGRTRIRGYQPASRTQYRKSYAALNARTGGTLGVDLKWLDTSLTSGILQDNADLSSGVVNPVTQECLSAMAQGDGVSERIGKRVIIKNVQVKGVCEILSQANAGAPLGDVFCFVALILDTQTNGTEVLSQQVYTNPSASPALPCWPMRNLEYTHRFKVLAKAMGRFSPASSQAANVSSSLWDERTRTFRFNFYKKCGIQANYTGNSDIIDNVVDNSIQMIAWYSHLGSPPFGSPVIHYNARIRYIG